MRNFIKMSTSNNELQALAQVSSEIDESEVKSNYFNQCIKAQKALTSKLKEEIHRRKEIANLKKKENIRLEVEIKNAEKEKENSRIVHNTMNSAKTEMKTELLLTKEYKSKVQNRITEGEKKYEELWIKCKEKYENMTLVKKLLQDKNRCEELKNDIHILEQEAQNLEKAVKEKKNILNEQDKKQVIQLAHFFVNEIPSAMKTIKEKTDMVHKMTNELEEIANKEEEKRKTRAPNRKTASSIENKNDRSEKSWCIDASPMMPKLHLPRDDLDVVNFKLNINTVNFHQSPVKRDLSVTEIEKNTSKKRKMDETLKDTYISCYFNTNTNDQEENKQDTITTDYSKKKLINIIEDIKINETETYNLIAKTNIDKFQDVDVIFANKNNAKKVLDLNSSQPLEIEEIEDVDIPNSNQQDLLIPPTQFLDQTQGKAEDSQQPRVEANLQVQGGHAENQTLSHLKSSQEGTKKKVSFDLPMSNQEGITLEEVEEVGTLNETATSQLNLSDATDENYLAIKDMILKKKNQMDLSPQFVYSKNTLQKQIAEENMTSKFFTINKDTEDENAAENEENLKSQQTKTKETIEDKIVSMDVDVNAAETNPEAKDRPVSGLLFTHGPQGIPDCLDISMSTTGYEEGDSEYPTCFDSSLLLSPKADEVMPMSGNQSETGSQDLPSFLTGFRKGGLSFFKQQPAESTNEGNMQSSDNNFNFSFGTEEKKAKGGLFSFFR